MSSTDARAVSKAGVASLSSSSASSLPVAHFVIVVLSEASSSASWRSRRSFTYGRNVSVTVGGNDSLPVCEACWNVSRMNTLHALSLQRGDRGHVLVAAVHQLHQSLAEPRLDLADVVAVDALKTSVPFSRSMDLVAGGHARIATSMSAFDKVVIPVLPVSSMNICGESFWAAGRGAAFFPSVASRFRFFWAIEFSGVDPERLRTPSGRQHSGRVRSGLAQPVVGVNVGRERVR